MNTHVDVALILWNVDVIQWVSCVLLQENVKSCSMEPSDGAQKMEELIASRGADVVMLDLAPPYEQSADVFLRLRARFPDRTFVITCADPLLALKAAPWLCSYRILQKPYEPEVIREVVVSLVRRCSQGSISEAAPRIDVAAMKIERRGHSCFCI